jgi:IS5 family transposase
VSTLLDPLYSAAKGEPAWPPLKKADPPRRWSHREIFGNWNRCYGLRRMRWRGLAKAVGQLHLAAIVYNLKRTLSIVTATA